MIQLALIAAAIAIAFGAGWETHSWKTDAKTLKEVIHQGEQADAGAVAHEVFKEKERIKYVTITKTVDRIVSGSFYTAAPECFDDAGLRELNAAISGKAASEPSAGVPASGPTQ